MADFKKTFTRYGFSLFEPENVEEAIVQAIKNGELRYIYGIPIILERTDANYKSLIDLADKEGIKDKLIEILTITARLLKDKSKIKVLRKLVGKEKAGKNYSYEEFEGAFIQYQKLGDNANFPPQINYHMTTLFTPKQISIISKVKERKPLSKTEKEYYSRVIKKRLVAIKELGQLVAEVLQGK